IKTNGDDVSDVLICTFSTPTNRERNGCRVSISFTRYNSSVSVTLLKTPDVTFKRWVVSSKKMGTMSQQKRPHKRYTPKFFHCDDVPRQRTSSDMPELVWVTEIPLAMRVGHSKPENILSKYFA